MSEDKVVFTDVILPLAIGKTYTYRVPRELAKLIKIGQRVIVPFGRGTKYYTAIVKEFHFNPPKDYTAKYVEEIIDLEPTIDESQFKFWEWLSSYYMCSLGEVMNAAIPAGLKIASDTQIILNEGYEELASTLSEKEKDVIDVLVQRNSLDLGEVAVILNVKNAHGYVKSLLEQGVITVVQEIKEKYKAKKATFVSLSTAAEDEDYLKKALDDLEKAPKQLKALLTFLQIKAEEGQDQISKLKIQKRGDVGASVMNQLFKKGILNPIEIEVGRLEKYSGEVNASNALNSEQESALKNIQQEFEEKDIALLHGVTSSGKTEVYIKLIEETIRKGKQVLYLLPEIALTTQLITRLQRNFGEHVGVYHSKFNEQERVEVWRSVKPKSDAEPICKVALGARSSVFLPFHELGLIIVDEEHENSFKQFDPSPRYNARDAATVLGKIHNAKVLLGSATPSIESYWNAEQKRYGFAEMKKRFGGVMMPEILCADIADATKRKKMNGHFSPLMIEQMEMALENKEQIILFQNRRGYAPIMLCETCGNSPQCKNCDVSLTYHKYFNHLNCHYCNYSIPVPTTCPSCGSGKIRLRGFGTEKIEEDLSLVFPEAKVARMDFDSTRSKHAHRNIIFDFENRMIDILVGTQMITKGLDFDNVGLVGILNADNMLQFPDFRSFERSYQLMAQVSGRAGRKKKRGKVVIQSFNPEHEIIRNVIDYDYDKMYHNELIERRNFKYPPFYRLIQFTLMHRDVGQLDRAVISFHENMRGLFGDRILGPQIPPVSRIRNFYHKNFMLKIERDKSLNAVKEMIRKNIDQLEQSSIFKGVRIKIDVDPM